MKKLLLKKVIVCLTAHRSLSPNFPNPLPVNRKMPNRHFNAES